MVFEEIDKKTFKFCWSEIRKAVAKEPGFGKAMITDYAICEFVSREGGLSKATIIKLRKVFIDGEIHTFQRSSLNKLARFVSKTSASVDDSVSSWKELKVYLAFEKDTSLEVESTQRIEAPQTPVSSPSPNRRTLRGRIIRSLGLIIVLFLLWFAHNEYSNYLEFCNLEAEFNNLEAQAAKHIESYDDYVFDGKKNKDMASYFYYPEFEDKYMSLLSSYESLLVSDSIVPIQVFREFLEKFRQREKGYHRYHSFDFPCALFVQNCMKSMTYNSKEINFLDINYPRFFRRRVLDLKARQKKILDSWLFESYLLRHEPVGWNELLENYN